MKHYIIYIPGLGDHYDAGRSTALKFWRLFGVTTQLLPMQWNAGSTYEDKFKEVMAAIKRAQDAGYAVSLVGESAGASMALNAAVQASSLYSIVLLAGIASTSTPISSYIKARSPAFAASVAALSKTLAKIDTSNIHIVQALWDPTVPTRHNQINGAHAHTIWSIGHIPTIVLCITLLSPFIIMLAKRGKGAQG